MSAGFLRRLLAELRRRRVLGVAAAYGVLAWGVIQFAGTVLQMAAAPAWIAKAVLAVVAVGFPLALVLAWFFDVSWTGIARTAPVDDEAPGAAAGDGAVRGRRDSPFVAAAGVLLIAALLTGFAVWLRPGATADVVFTQLTNFSDAATAPALSPDGRLLAFLKGGGPFGNSGAPAQLYVKPLPDGQAVQLTNTPNGKATPVFTPDGARITFTSAEPYFRWATAVVSVNGGPVTQLLPNASGLTWLDSVHVLYSETRGGAHMGLRRSTVTRADVRDVYWPPTEQSMAHRSAVSPDGRWILLVEMYSGVWQPCRLIPFDGASTGRQVGPLDGQCTYAAWSPDGRWMYFSSSAGGAFHIWRQRFPDGEPEQLTRGPTEEEGIAVAPDGRSLITSAGVRHNAIHLYDEAGDRPLSDEEFAFLPIASKDGARVHFLSRTGTARSEYHVGTLVATTLESGVREPLLPGHTMVHYDLSADDSLVVFASGSDDAVRRGIWIAPLDRTAAPRRIYAGETERAFLDPERNVYFLASSGRRRYLHRLVGPDYTVNERVSDRRLHLLFAISPDGAWIVAGAPPETGEGVQQIAVSTRGLPPRMICAFCGGGAGPVRTLAQPIAWTRDGSTLLVAAQFVGELYWMGPAYTIAIPVAPDATLPALPDGGVTSVHDYLALPGARTIPRRHIVPGATAQQLFTIEPTTIRNLYRLQLPPS